MKILYLPHAYSQQRQFEKKRKIYPILMAMEAEWYKQRGHEVNWGNGIGKYDKVISEPEGLPFLELPHPNRIFTRWWEYQDNGNFKHLPATYIQSASGCWHGKCSFCVEQWNKWEVRHYMDVYIELQECYTMGFREVFDDSGTFPTGKWLEDLLISPLPITLSCNMRMVNIDYGLMKHRGFRMLLFGLESANQKTLDRINKGTKVEDIKYVKKASKAGLEPHITVMFGFPWETDEDALRTLRLVWELLKKGHAKTAQASFYSPPDNSGNESHRKYIPMIYNVAKSPRFWLTKIRDLHSIDDLKYLWKSIKVGINDINNNPSV